MAGKKVKKNLDLSFAGQEPMLNIVEGRNDPQLTDVYNWYNYCHDDKQSHAWLVQWMKTKKYDRSTIEVVKSAPVWAAGTTAGWNARMELNGTIFANDNIEYVKSCIDNVVTRYSNVEKEEELVPTTTVYDRVLNKVSALLSQAEEEIVDAFMNDSTKIPSMYDFLIRTSASTQVANQLKSMYKPQYDEIFCDDPQVKEAFGKHLKSYQKFWTSVIDDLDRYLNNKKVVKIRKPKTIKIKPASKMVERLNYQKDFAPLKLVSVDPQQLIGAQSVWTYNTKSRVLSVFYAENTTGINVKGSTLIGWNVDSSTGKRLRKPEQTLTELLSAGKVVIRKILPALSTTEIKPTGRINNDTIILKVTK